MGGGGAVWVLPVFLCAWRRCPPLPPCLLASDCTHACFVTGALHLPPAELIAESASTALGGVAAGNLGAYLPLLLRHVHAQAGNPKQLYQLLKVCGDRWSRCSSTCGVPTTNQHLWRGLYHAYHLPLLLFWFSQPCPSRCHRP